MRPQTQCGYPPKCYFLAGTLLLIKYIPATFGIVFVVKRRVRDVMKKYIVLMLVTLLAGCSHYEWVKPGSTNQQREVEETACNADALKKPAAG